jgi:hypothetical protein
MLFPDTCTRRLATYLQREKVLGKTGSKFGRLFAKSGFLADDSIILGAQRP